MDIPIAGHLDAEVCQAAVFFLVCVAMMITCHLNTSPIVAQKYPYITTVCYVQTLVLLQEQACNGPTGKNAVLLRIRWNWQGLDALEDSVFCLLEGALQSLLNVVCSGEDSPLHGGREMPADLSCNRMTVVAISNNVEPHLCIQAVLHALADALVRCIPKGLSIFSTAASARPGKFFEFFR